MFTGIVQAIGRIVSVRPFVIDAGRLPLRGVKAGDSVCVQGCCLTVTRKRGRRLSFDVSRETLRVTAGLDHRGEVNLEKSLAFGDPLGGHFVTGHVDGVGEVSGYGQGVLKVRAPTALAKYIARKGSVTVDGVSLTVNAVRGATFEVFLIPHTLRMTTLRGLARGAKVNLEVDLLARYAHRRRTSR
ncbi:MAG TPA: riboflavin synthase [Burkholderiales bacterium]|nr:riboflavin synthase [Burkholderiales bacterium]